MFEFIYKDIDFAHKVDEASNPTEQYAKHIHPFNEIVLFITGDVVYTVETESRTLHPGDIVFIPSGKYHFATVNKDAKYERYVLKFPDKFLPDYIKEKQEIDLVIKLSEWKKDAEYDRMGMEDEHTEYLGNQVVCHSVPIRPGRNLAVICETAAVNHRQKKMGYNAAQELYRRVQENLVRNREEE